MRRPPPDRIARERIQEAQDVLRGSLLGLLLPRARVELSLPGSGAPAYGVVEVQSGRIVLNPRHDLGVEHWTYVIAHLALHLAFEHRPEIQRREPFLWMMACDLFLDGFLHHLKLGTPPPAYVPHTAYAGQREEAIYERLLASPRGSWPLLSTMAGSGYDVRASDPPRSHEPNPDYPALLAAGLRVAVSSAVDQAADAASAARSFAPAEHARRWIMQQIPLLGALSAELRIVADEPLCRRLHISIAAVDASLGEIYVNPAAPLSGPEWLFVVAHEVLHVALFHRSRCQGRDPHIWNLACDFVINGWLLAMGVGQMPLIGSLFDPRLEGMSAEAVYDLLLADPRRVRGLRGLRGDLGDILFEGVHQTLRRCDACTLDDLVRRCLAAGLSCPSRGLVPAGLVEEIRSLFTPPVPWDVELARWMDHHVPFPREKRRSFARASRRQGATPDIPRPGRYHPAEWLEACTFGVVLDTSGSMDRPLLGRALGAIASYAEARDVPLVRVVCCDARPYDLGPLSPQQLRDVVALRGRGGTVLQPAITYLCNQRDLPASAPLMILTDGYCEEQLHVPREHCFVLPRPWARAADGAAVHRNVILRTTAPVFRVLKDG